MTATHRVEGHAVEELILSSTDGTISHALRDALRAHLHDCPTCEDLSRQHQRLVQRLGAPIETSKAAQESLARVRRAAVAAPHVGWRRPRAIVTLVAGASVALVLAVIASLAIGESVARLRIPERELISEHSELLDSDRLVLRVEDGRFAATPDQTSGVLASAELTLTIPRTGAAELRFGPPGEPYGVLAIAPDLVGVTRLRIENRLPAVDRATVIEIWVHIEGEQTTDSARLRFQVEPRNGGLRARPLPSVP